MARNQASPDGTVSQEFQGKLQAAIAALAEGADARQGRRAVPCLPHQRLVLDAVEERPPQGLVEKASSADSVRPHEHRVPTTIRAQHLARWPHPKTPVRQPAICRLAGIVSEIGVGDGTSRDDDATSSVREHFRSAFTCAEGNTGGQISTRLSTTYLRAERTARLRDRHNATCSGSLGLGQRAIQRLRAQSGVLDFLLARGSRLSRAVNTRVSSRFGI